MRWVHGWREGAIAGFALCLAVTRSASAQSEPAQAEQPPGEPAAAPSVPAPASPTPEAGDTADAPVETAPGGEQVVADPNATQRGGDVGESSEPSAVDVQADEVGEEATDEVSEDEATSDEGPTDICEIDPDACPVLDFHKSKTAPLTGDILCAQAVSKSPNPGAKSSDRIILPSQDMEVGGEMVFVTSDERLDAFGTVRDEVRFTDVGLLRLRARRSFSDWLELYAGGSVLAKQPASWDESVWQGAYGGARAVFADGFAVRLGGGGGPLFEELGYYWQASPGLQAKFNPDHMLRFDLGLGSTMTVIEGDENAETFWLEELSSHVELQFGDRKGAFWVRLDYGVPLASAPSSDAPDADSGRFLEPQIRLGAQVGGVLTIDGWNEDGAWDAYFAYGFVDRGELNRPETVLPLLDEGFDQSQIIVGVQHRFDTDTCKHRACGKCYD
jgi:hypothetical protein